VVYSYESIEDHPSFLRVAKEDSIENLPLPMKGLNLVVSHETVKAAVMIGRRLLKKKFTEEQEESLYYWLQKNNLQSVYKKKIRHISSRNYEKRWPELFEWFQKNIPMEEQSNYIKELKRYTVRNDLWAPGPRIRNEQGEVIACKGLINFYGVKDHL
jgi:hypothetical protein